jgi:hypothetical protein
MAMFRKWKERRLPKEVMKWRTLGRRKRGRPKLTWMEGIKGLMREKGWMEKDWNDRSNWSKKIMQHMLPHPSHNICSCFTNCFTSDFS